MLTSLQITDFTEEKGLTMKSLENLENKLEILTLEGHFTLSEALIKKLTNLKELYLNYGSYLTSKNLITLAENCKLETLHSVVSCDD